ncbi:unnamed protein product [Ceutorhynchus assimilis]|uniref:Uncharacterized protein n=1 Tax=Ceutorhynchus assimilis TaxID=467358 RepID=A0A9N9QED8_9CUCU|nr:unnamed protein product [Ceutorhynchus assimilis]
MAGVFSIEGSLEAKACCAKIILILLVTFASTFAAPQGGSDLRTNPCSNHAVRHVRSTAEKELKFFINTLNRTTHRLRRLYSDQHSKINFKRVKATCPRLNKLINPVAKATDIIVAHQQFHFSMIQLAEFLDKLHAIPIRTNTQFDFAERDNIFKETKNYLRLAICEFNETIMTEFKIQPNTNKAPRVKAKCLPREAGLTQIKMLDLQFFKQLKKFIKKGRKKLNSLKKKHKSQQLVREDAARTKS